MQAAPVVEDDEASARPVDASATSIGVFLAVVIMLSMDELNPVKILSSYACFLTQCPTDRQIAGLAAVLLSALVINQKERILYYCVRTFFRCTFNNMFFRSVEIVGMENLPKEGPVIITGNHNNQFVDAILLLTNCERRVSFMIAQVSCQRPLVGFLARVFRCIPVARAQDLAIAGAGLVVGDGSTTLRGVRTQFVSQAAVGGLVEIRPPSGGEPLKRKVVKVISDTELLVDEAYPASSSDGDAYKLHPKVDQSVMYDQVFEGLRKGNCLGIFPEGGSHDRTDLLPLKAGVAIIVLDAFAKHHMQVPIVPVGLNYFHGHRFGGRVVVEFGAPIVIPEELHQRHETDRRGATEEVLQIVATGMRSVIVPTQDYNTLQSIYMVRRLYSPDGLKLNSQETMDLNRRFAVGVSRIEQLSRPSGVPKEEGVVPGTEDVSLDAEELRCVVDFRRELEEYMATLKRLGLRDHQIRQIGWWGISDLIGRVLYLAATMVLGAIPQLIFNLPVMAIASRLAASEQKKALKKSTVKLAARDVVMSFKVIYVLVFIPVVYVILGASLWFLSTWCVTSIMLVLAILPFFALLGTKASEQGVRAYADIVPLFKRLLPATRMEQDRLPARRADIQRKVHRLVKMIGPRLGDLYTQKVVDWSKEIGPWVRSDSVGSQEKHAVGAKAESEAAAAGAGGAARRRGAAADAAAKGQEQS